MVLKLLSRQEMARFVQLGGHKNSRQKTGTGFAQSLILLGILQGCGQAVPDPSDPLIRLIALNALIRKLQIRPFAKGLIFSVPIPFLGRS